MKDKIKHVSDLGLDMIKSIGESLYYIINFVLCFILLPLAILNHYFIWTDWYRYYKTNYFQNTLNTDLKVLWFIKYTSKMDINTFRGKKYRILAYKVVKRQRLILNSNK